MLHTYEAVLQPDGRLQFVDLPTTQTQSPRRVLVTFTDQVPAAADAVAPSPSSGPNDWMEWVGALRASPNWQGDPQAVQEAMRHEWN